MELAAEYICPSEEPQATSDMQNALLASS